MSGKRKEKYCANSNLVKPLVLPVRLEKFDR